MSMDPQGERASTAEKANSAQRGTWSELNRDATILGGLRSTVEHYKRGAAVIRRAGGDLMTASSGVLNRGDRIETFEAAMDRTNVSPEDLPLIHNQILFQSYLCFFVGLIALTMGVQYVVGSGQFAAGALSAVIGVTSLFFFAQASAQALQIRRRQLGLLGVWARSPAEWFGSRMAGLRRMSRSDPLRHPEVVIPLAMQARRRMFLTVVCAALALVVQFAAGTWGLSSWAIVFYAGAAMAFVNGARLAFEVFRRREGLHIDLGGWVLSPADWIPSLNDPRTDDLAKTSIRKRSATAGDGANAQLSDQALEKNGKSEAN